MNIQAHISEIQRQHARHLSVRNRLWGNAQKVKTVKVAKPVEMVKVRVRADVDFSYHVELYRKHQAESTIYFGLSCSFSAPMTDEYRSYLQSLTYSHVTPAKPSMKDICMEVLKDFPGVTLEDVRGARRTKNVIDPRHACMRAVYFKRKDMSLPRIAKFFNRDHTVILYAVHKAEMQPR